MASTEKGSQWDADMATLIGAAPEPRVRETKIGRLKKFSDYDDPWGGDGTKLMPHLRAIHKMGEVKLAEPPPPKGVSVKEWDKILAGKRKLAEDRPVAKTEFQGLPIGIENPKGSVREGTDRNGHHWKTKMKLPYGFIEGTKGKDGDSVDVFVGPDKAADKAFVVHQRTPDGKKYDEDKVFLGLRSKREAKEAFMAHNDNPKALGDVAEVSMERLQQLCEEKGRLTKISQASYEAMLRELLKVSGVAEQMRMGEKVEQEHEGTIEYLKREPNMPARKVEQLIASDHIREIPDYYTRLKKMEGEAEKKAAAPVISMGKRIVGTLAKNPSVALAGAGAVGGGIAGGPGGALAGAGLGFGAGKMGLGTALQKGVMGKSQWLGTGAQQYTRGAVKEVSALQKANKLAAPPKAPGAIPPPPAAGVAAPMRPTAGAAPRQLEMFPTKVGHVKQAWSWEGFKEGLQDEGIPLSGATIGAGLGGLLKHRLPITPLTGAALGYAGGSGASILRSKLKGEEPSTARRVLALSGLGYGMGGMAHAGVKALTKNIKPGTVKSIFHGVEGRPDFVHGMGEEAIKKLPKINRTHGVEALTEEMFPAIGATGMTGVALATDKAHKSSGHVVPPGERGAPVG